MNKRILFCCLALAIMPNNSRRVLDGLQLPSDVEAEKQAFLNSSMPLLALRAEEIQNRQSDVRQNQAGGFYQLNRQASNSNPFRLKQPRKLISVVSPKAENDLGMLPENPSAIPRVLRAKSHKTKVKGNIQSKRKGKAKAKAHKHKASKGHKSAHKHRNLKSQRIHRSAKLKHRALIARISKAIAANKARQANQMPHKTVAQQKVENQLLRKILLDMDTKTANKLINQQTRALPGKPIHLNKRKLLQVLRGERKLGFGTDIMDTIKNNLLMISAGLAIGGHFYRRRVDDRHDRLLKRINQMRGTLTLKVGLMNEAVEMLDKINSQMKAETSRLLIEDEMYDKRFQSKIDRIKNLPI